MVKDPVGGMVIDEKSAVAQSEYKGKTCYFMSLGNKKTFDQKPVKYTEGGRQEMTVASCHQMQPVCQV